MKIGIDARALMDAQYSGVSEYTLNLIREILKLDEVNDYRLFYNCFADSRRIPEFQGKNVKIVKYGYPNKVLNYLLFKIFNWPKMDQALDVDFFYLPHINFIGLSRKKKSLLTIHDLSFLRYPEFFSSRKNFWHRMVNVKKLLNRFSQIVAVSENTKRDIVELCGLEPDKVKVIYSGVGEEYRKINFSAQGGSASGGHFSIHQMAVNFQKNNNSQITELNPDEKRLLDVKNKYSLPDKFILYLGTIEPRKNIDGLIRAYNRLRLEYGELSEVKLVIAGGVGWKSRPVFRAWEKSVYKNDIKFLGYIDTRDKVYLYNLALIFLYPSFYEGFGLPPLEAMASGVPVILSSASSLSEVSGDAALMIDPYNIGDLSRAIAELLLNDDLRNKYRERGLKRARLFSWEKTAKEYLQVINNL